MLVDGAVSGTVARASMTMTWSGSDVRMDFASRFATNAPLAVRFPLILGSPHTCEQGGTGASAPEPLRPRGEERVHDADVPAIEPTD